MDRILIATDLSPRSARAVKRGFLVASFLGSQARVVSIVDDSMPESLVEGLVADVTKELQRETVALAIEVPCNYEVEVLAGDVSEAIVREAAEFEADLIVLGLHRNRAMIDSIRETTMERTVRLSHLPVFLVRNAVGNGYHQVLCAIDFSPASAASAAAAGSIAGNATFNLFHAYYAPHHVRADIPVNVAPFTHHAEAERQKWSDANPMVSDLGTVELIEGALWSVFEKQVAQHNPDLVALGAHSRPPLARLLLGSFTKDLIRSPPTDVLVCHP